MDAWLSWSFWCAGVVWFRATLLMAFGVSGGLGVLVHWRFSLKFLVPGCAAILEFRVHGCMLV